MKVLLTIASLVFVQFGLTGPTAIAADAKSPYEIIPLKPLFADFDSGWRIIRPISDKLIVGQILSEKGADQFRAKYGVTFTTDDIDFDKQMLVFGITDFISFRAFQLLRNRRFDDSYVLDYYNAGLYRRLKNPGKDKQYSIVQVFVISRNERMIGNVEVKRPVFGKKEAFAGR